ncbi:MAG: hypothetical protein IJ574_04915 [Bacilli bacterium]|nr:hypothetical protein [Bacilli bacterium]
MKCDVLVVGSSNENLLLALELIEKGKNVLIIDTMKRSIELENIYKLDRFEFVDNYEYLYTERVKKLLNYYDITSDSDYEEYKYHTNLVTYDENYEYEITSSAKSFISQVKTYFSNTKNMDELFKLALECFKATNLELQNEPVNKDLYPNYYKYKNVSYKKVLDKLHINRNIQNLLETLTELPFNIPFNDFATTLYATIVEKKYKLTKNNLYLFYKLRKRILSSGTKIIYNVNIKSINVIDGKINNVVLDDDIVIECNSLVYGKMPSTIIPILNSNIIKPTDINKINQTTKVKIFLGLIKPLQEINLNKGKYIIKSNDNYDINNVNETLYLDDYDNKSIITIECNYKNNCWNNYITREKYFYQCEKIANELVGCFEDLTKKDIKEYIDQIKIVTPVDYANKNENEYGASFEELSMDLKNRLLSIKNLYITNLYLEYDYLFNSKYLVNNMLAKRIGGASNENN